MWLSQEGPTSRKHKEWMHPVVTFVVHYISVINLIIIVHDALVHTTSVYFEKGNVNDIVDEDTINNCIESSILIRRQKYVACFFALYFFLCLGVRLALQWKTKQSYTFYCEYYQMTFLCSVTIMNVSISFFFNRPIIAQSFCLAVGIDQFLWYFDLAGYFLCGIFPAGVCTYLSRNNWVHRITSSHHLWTIPLVFWGCGGVFHWLAIPLSGIVIILNVFLSRWMTPISILGEDDEKSLYLNINLSHEMWRDVTFFNPTPYAPYLVRLIFWWYLTNVIVFAILCGISRLFYYGSNSTTC
mmetsp:Transcript_34317/g.38417  ORF Transcript_34317/g.38417 Transcript_34317/m.38417 type:complete len:298 (-) Transcript_34317:818-1711(-)